MTPDSEQWERLQALFHQAEAIPDDRLEAWLRDACPDAGLRERARALIRAEREASRDAGATASPGHSTRIGPYTVIRHLGSGGIGAVYLVERVVGGAVQRTALKALSLHAAGPLFTDRFEREQHILASLNHPNITRMLDAGLDETGQPFLVMEYVEGTHLDVYCDTHTLGIPDRLGLFLKVCEAVAYAHRNLVVHLDLKPSNILVTEAEGTVKLLDFGTSKLIQPDSLLTTTVMATPAYASPEQLRNEGVTTASDTYSLGAVLFELLAGRRPNQESSVAAMIERSIKEMPPEPLPEAVTQTAAEHRGLTQTRLRNLLTGDLATIVGKCLQSRPRDRYASVDALIDDLQRFLSGRPVLARPQTTTYRIAKFVRRNSAAVIAGTLAACALAVSLGYAAWRQEQAVREGRRALQMQTFMSQLFQLANTSYMGKPAATVPEFLQLGVKVLPDFIADPGDRRAAQLSLAKSMFANGDYKLAEPLFAEVIRGAREANDLPVLAEAEADAGNLDFILAKDDAGMRLTADALTLARKRGVTPSVRVEIEDYFAYNRETNGFRSDGNVKILRDAYDESRRAHLPARQTAAAANYLALSLEDHGGLPEAESLFRQSLDLYRGEGYAVCDEGLMYRYLGSIRSQRQDVVGALNFYKQAYQRIQRCSGDGSLETMAIQGYMANAMIKLGDAKSVIPMLEAALPQYRKTVGADSSHIATPLLFLTRAYLATGRFDDAEPTARELNRVIAGKMNAHSSTTGVCQEAWALALAGQHRYPEAIEHAHIAVDAFPDHPNPGEKANLEKARITLANIQAAAKGSQAPINDATAKANIK